MNQSLNSSGKPTNSLVWQLVEKLDEQRAHPRISLDQSIALRGADGETFSAMVDNISPDGLRLRLDVEAARRAHPGGGRIDPAAPPVVELALALCTAAGTRTLETTAEIIYLTTVDTAPRCVMGVRFSGMSRAAKAALNAYFADQFLIDADSAA